MDQVTKSSVCMIPPQIKQYFDANLLTTPRIKFCEDAETLNYWFDNAIQNLLFRLKKCPGRLREANELIERWKLLYERIEKTQKDCEAAAGDKKQRSMYYFTYLDKESEWLLRRSCRG